MLFLFDSSTAVEPSARPVYHSTVDYSMSVVVLLKVGLISVRQKSVATKQEVSAFTVGLRAIHCVHDGVLWTFCVVRTFRVADHQETSLR